MSIIPDRPKSEWLPAAESPLEDDSYRMPAHRFDSMRMESEERKKDKKKGKVITFDFDETITKAPKQMAHLAKALKKAGDEIWVVTGNEADRKDLEGWLDEYGFKYDGLIQYHDDETDGLQRENILKELNAWLAFDDRAGRAPVLVKACPHLFLAAKATKDNLKAEEDAKSAKKIVKQAKNES